MKNKTTQLIVFFIIILISCIATFLMYRNEYIEPFDTALENTGEANADPGKASKEVFESNKKADEKSDKAEDEKTTSEETTPASFDITLSFIGDCLCATDVNAYYENRFNDVAQREDPSYFFAKVNHIFTADDYTIGDCENVFSDSEDLPLRDKGQYANPGIEAYWFKGPASSAKILSAGGIDFVSTSNNHINDYGEQGHKDTLKALEDAGVEWGEEGKVVHFEKNGFKIAIICFSMYGYEPVPSVIETIEEESKTTDYQILYFHGGEEALHYAEDWKIRACHDLVDGGADLIMGDHPHVLQPMEEYNGVTIIYSLGNFIFGGNRHPENRTIIYQHTLTVKNGKLKKQSGNMIPCFVYTGDTNNWQPDIIEDETIKNKIFEYMKGNTSSPV